jgi:hypothetical protein
VANEHLRSTTFVGTSAVIAMLTLAGCSQREKLDQSLTVLMTQLRIPYEISSSSLDAEETDLSGIWRVQLTDDSSGTVPSLMRGGFQQADDSDVSEFKRVIAERLKPSEDLSGARAFRAERALGPGTICESLTCNIDVLIPAEGRTAYFSISKI